MVREILAMACPFKKNCGANVCTAASVGSIIRVYSVKGDGNGLVFVFLPAQRTFDPVLNRRAEADQFNVRTLVQADLDPAVLSN